MRLKIKQTVYYKFVVDFFELKRYYIFYDLLLGEDLIE